MVVETSRPAMMSAVMKPAKAQKIPERRVMMKVWKR
jgi:hypothetical protein